MQITRGYRKEALDESIHDPDVPVVCAGRGASGGLPGEAGGIQPRRADHSGGGRLSPLPVVTGVGAQGNILDESDG